MIVPQILSARTVLRWRGAALLALGTVALALFLTSSRASFLAFAISLAVIAIIRYRKIIPFIIAGGLLILLLPQTQAYIDRLMQAFAGADLATQMRIGEWTDSLRLISRYPVFGVGFTGTPGIDVYTDVANMYLIMANEIGLTGVAIFLTTMAGVFLYGRRAWRAARSNPLLEAIHLGAHLALLAALTNAFADLYFFRLDFQASITWFWLTVALALTSSRLAIDLESERQSTPAVESTVAKPAEVM